MYIIGGTGPNENNLRLLVENEGLLNNVLFLGQIPEEEIVLFHQMGDVFIMPNRTLDSGDTEGFGIVFLEANAVGKAVIGGNAGGVVEAVEDGKTGLLVDSRDIKAIEKALRLLIENKSLRNKLGQNGRLRAQKDFQWVFVADKLYDGLQSNKKV